MQQYVKNYLYASTPQTIVEEEKFPGCPDWMNYYFPQRWHDKLPKNIKGYYDRIQEKTLEMRRNQAQFQNVQPVQLQPQVQAQFQNTQSVQLHQQSQAQVHGAQEMQLQPQAQFQNTQSVQLQRVMVSITSNI